MALEIGSVCDAAAGMMGSSGNERFVERCVLMRFMCLVYRSRWVADMLDEGCLFRPALSNKTTIHDTEVAYVSARQPRTSSRAFLPGCLSEPSTLAKHASQQWTELVMED